LGHISWRRTRRKQLPSCFDLAFGHSAFSATYTALSFCRFQSGACPFDNQLSFHLLIRYMKLSTFLLLVSNNRLFLPTVRKLQESDPREANLQLGWCQAYWRMMWPLVEAHKA
jgi:hypothetical protein